MPRRVIIPPRKRFFIGCEGESEQSYARLLEMLAREKLKLHVTFDAPVLRGGDPLAIVQRAVDEVKRGRGHGDYLFCAVLLDRDKIGVSPERDRLITGEVERAGIHPMWQDPCHEALLIRHIPTCSALRPTTTQQALEILKGNWPQYRKGMSAKNLATRIGLGEVRSAVASDTAISLFLKKVGILREEDLPRIS